MPRNSGLVNIGYDIDGTLTKETWWEALNLSTINWAKYWSFVEQSIEERKKIINVARLLQPSIIPKQPCYIITNRPINLMGDITMQWLKEFDIPFIELQMTKRPPVGEAMIFSKIEAIKRFNLNVYVEDNEYISDGLKQHCSNVRIISPEDALNEGLAKPVYLQ